MNARNAGISFLGICIILALLLLFHVITPIVSGAVFAIALMIFGGISQGFR